MEQTLTAKVRLYPNSEQAKQFKEVTKEYQRLCNIISQWYFDEHFLPERKRFQKEMYHDLRLQSKLNSLMIQSVFRTVVARYKTVKTQLYQHPYKYRDINTSEWHREFRDLNWLQKPITFSRPQADYVRSYNYSFVQKGTKISLNVLNKRIKVPFNSKYLPFSLEDKGIKLGTAKLVCLKGRWFLHMSYTKKVDSWKIENNQHVVGIDRGLRFITTAYDEKGKTNFVSGKNIAYKRKKYAYLRSKLQSKGTKSAKRKLKRLSQKENRWMADFNHCLSKTLIEKYGQNSLFVLEDLTGVTFEKSNVNKNLTRELHSWSFYDLQTKLTYKAQGNQSQVLIVSAKYTSQRCPKCGQIRKENRNHDLHEYKCTSCGFRTNDDRVGAMNLQELGKQYISGIETPKFELNNVTD
ncbi:IS607 family transposase [Ligilactobacillus hayakitensis DSM 18933 = JCM 14209]|uniref:IS607 family transposase n=1 Tax=Ligilactobacillus hayakitensis DSM 18933 = JCM 14209 TaxID=1423755 RepID=A0A0R1WX83_9LACO|nr:RNA-guided endonuclease TnpB family protein [Ligilactobacillus hayakitensis]KRM20203.1 IS607 family transposase [Ligilactobacillus hayakitensis DSM 18933 = JCM 14209]